MSQPLTIGQLLQRAIGHYQAGRLADAEASCRQILTQNPQETEALHLLGILALQTKRLPEALGFVQQALAGRGAWPKALNTQGTIFKEMRRFDEAIHSYQQALALAPEQPEILLDLGTAFMAQGKMHDAIAIYRRAVAARPSYAPAYNNLGLAFLELSDWDNAIQACSRALQLEPNMAEAYNNLGHALRARDRMAEATECYRQALRLRPHDLGAMWSLANVLNDTGQQTPAKEYFQTVVQMRPDFAPAHLQLGNILRNECRMDEALASYRQALACDPAMAVASSNILLTMHYILIRTPEMILAEARQWEQRHAAPLPARLPPHHNDPAPDRRLRIGYVSADFRFHSCAFFLHPLLAHHDHQQVEIYCYADDADADAMTQTLHAAADHWISTTGMPDQALAQRVQEDRIDILVDLMGHTGNNRLLVFARKPAPLQVTYLGYPDSTGLAAMDYRFTDAHADPPGMTETLHTEELIRLPDTFICYEPPAIAPPVNSLPASTTGHFTFASFNELGKVSALTISLWAAILQRLPAARLLLKSRHLSQAGTRQLLRERFAQAGIGPERLEFHGTILPLAEHLACYHHVDVALDPYPYHGTTTTCEALWMGVPLVTLAGRAHVSRVGASLLSNVGLEALIAATPEEYVEKAVALAQDLPKLAELRAGLRERLKKSRLLDAPAFARHVEAAYRSMWQRWCQTARNR